MAQGQYSLSEAKPIGQYALTDAKSEPAASEVDPNTTGTVLRHFWSGVNPVQLGQMLPFPKSMGGSGTDNPIDPRNIAQSMHNVKREGDEAWDKGDKVTAAAKYVESLLPIIGPWMSKQGNQWQQGKYAAAIGDTAALAATTAIASNPEATADVAAKTVTSAGDATGKGMSAVGTTMERVGKSPAARRMSEVGAMGEVIRGNLGGATLSIVIPKAVQYLGTGLRNLGEILQSTDPLTAQEVAALQAKLANPALSNNPMAKAAIAVAIKKRGGVPIEPPVATPIARLMASPSFAKLNQP